MERNNDATVLAGYIKCLSLLEEDTFTLYKNLADKVELSLVKSLFQSIADDSHKHSQLLRGLSESIAETREDRKICRKNIGEVWDSINTFKKEISARECISASEMSELSKRLVFLESSMGEEYYMFVQMDTLQRMTKEINQIYKIDLASLKKIFLHIIEDEEHHREILADIQAMFETEPDRDSSPVVRYQNPDSWIAPPTPAETARSSFK